MLRKLATLMFASLFVSGAFAADEKAAPGLQPNVKVTIRLGKIEQGKRNVVKTYDLVVEPETSGSKLLSCSRVPVPTGSEIVYQNIGFSAEAMVWLVCEGRIKLAAKIEDSRLSDKLGRIPGYLILPAGILTGSTEVETTTGVANIEVIGTVALETVRVEEQVPAAGRELGTDVNALEAGLKSVISFSKGCYIGQEVIARLDTYKTLRTIIALFAVETDGVHAPETGQLFQDGREAGRITSTAYSPLREGWIGLGFRPIRTGNPVYLLGQGAGAPSVRCTCVSMLPPGYEDYEVEE